MQSLRLGFCLSKLLAQCPRCSEDCIIRVSARPYPKASKSINYQITNFAEIVLNKTGLGVFSVLRVTDREQPFSDTGRLLVSSTGWLQVSRDAPWAEHTRHCLAEPGGHGPALCHGLTSLTQEALRSKHPPKLQKKHFHLPRNSLSV